MKKICFGIILLAVMCLTVTSCFIEDDPEELYGNIVKSPPWGNGDFNGTVEGSDLGFEGKITVVLEIELGEIKAIEVTHKETEDIGGAFINRVKPLIVLANSFDIDAISKATCEATKSGLVKAGKTALKKIPDAEVD